MITHYMYNSYILLFYFLPVISSNFDFNLFNCYKINYFTKQSPELVLKVIRPTVAAVTDKQIFCIWNLQLK